MIKQLVAASALALFAMPAMATTTVFTNSAPIVIPDSAETTSTINVTGLTSPITGLTLTLNGLSHTFPDDLVFGIVNQATGLGFVFMSGAGGGTDVVGVNLTFSDAAASQLPESFVGGGIVSGTYLPSNYLDFEFINFANATAFSDFTGTSGNGAWTLYADDIADLDTGTVLGGFSLAFTTADATAVPEPASWAMLIAGFGLAGVAMRRRNVRTTVTYA